jgi:Ser/Thr protein kinase RdoA (MazF antagonist)
VRRLAQRPPHEQAELLRRVALSAISLWPLDCLRVDPIKVRENAVYAVYTGDGRRVALRVHRYGYHSNQSLESEFAWTRALGEHGLRVPVPILSRSGRRFEVVETPDFDEPRQVDVFEWIDGHTMGTGDPHRRFDGPWIERSYGALGELAAQIHNQSSAWQPPKDFERHRWDAAGLLGEQPLWGRFWELDRLTPQHRRFFMQMRKRAHEDLMAYGTTSDRYGMIHADLVPDNVLEDGNNLRVIDFDDSGFGWYAFELATSLYFLRHTTIFDRARDALIAGYRRVRPLDDKHVRLLPLFLAVRGTTYLAWLHTRRGEGAAQGRAAELIDMAAGAAADYLSQ